MIKRIEHHIICFVGRTNVGKSSLLNLLSGQKDYAIVDSTPGTTADTVTTVMEIHGVGPCKILDTAGVDECSVLGEKKRKKTLEAIEEADLSIVVIDLLGAAETRDLSIETELIERAERYGKQVLIIYNLLRYEEVDDKEIEKSRRLVDKLLGGLYPSIVVDATDMSQQLMIATFINTFFQHKIHTIDLLPSLKSTGYVLIVVPMDEETPALRLLRPQDMAVERILRHYATPVLFRPDLKKARSSDSDISAEESARFERTLKHLSESKEGLQLVITDSQAFDVVSNWIPEEIPFTSFSIMMTNYMSFGNLDLFIEGVKSVDSLKPGDNILIVEACNHSRKCNDIGTVQIPKLLNERIGGDLNFDFNFGRTYPEDVSKYKLLIHCGACMIDRQKYARRIVKAKEANVAITNYGILLSFLKSEEVLRRAVKPFDTNSTTTPSRVTTVRRSLQR